MRCKVFVHFPELKQSHVDGVVTERLKPCLDSLREGLISAGFKETSCFPARAATLRDLFRHVSNAESPEVGLVVLVKLVEHTGVKAPHLVPLVVEKLAELSRYFQVYWICDHKYVARFYVVDEGDGIVKRSDLPVAYLTVELSGEHLAEMGSRAESSMKIASGESSRSG